MYCHAIIKINDSPYFSYNDYMYIHIQIAIYIVQHVGTTKGTAKSTTKRPCHIFYYLRQDPPLQFLK